MKRLKVLFSALNFQQAHPVASAEMYLEHFSRKKNREISIFQKIDLNLKQSMFILERWRLEAIFADYPLNFHAGFSQGFAQ